MRATGMWMAALGLLVGVGCPGPDDNEHYDAGPQYIQFSGSLIRDSSSPAAGVTVKLLADGAELASVVAGTDGSYLFKVEQGRLASAALLSVRATVEVNGKQAEIGFDFAASSDLALPAARFLEAPTNPTAGTEAVTVLIPNYADPSDRRPAGYAVEVETQSGEALVSQTASASSSVITVNRKMLEDYATTWRLKALLQVSAGGVTISGYAAGLPAQLTAQNAAPLSRGKSCTYANTDQQTPVTLSPCPITDGDLATRPSATTICTDPDLTDQIQVCAAAYEELVVDLGSLQAINFFAVHDVADGKSVLIESSESGTAFHTVTAFTADNFVLDAASPINAHYLRLKYYDTTEPATNPSALAGLNEIVVY